MSESPIAIGGETGNYILTGWKDGATEFEKRTAQHPKDSRQYMVILRGPKGKIDKAVKSFGMGKE